MSMRLLSFFVWFTCLMVSNYVVGVMFDLSHLPSWASGMLRCLPGALAASTFLWSIKLPDGRYLFRQLVILASKRPVLTVAAITV